MVMREGIKCIWLQEVTMQICRINTVGGGENSKIILRSIFRPRPSCNDALAGSEVAHWKNLF